MSKASTRQKEAYRVLSLSHHPRRPVLKNVLTAYLVGGSICVLAQGIMNYLKSKVPAPEAMAMTSSAMIFLGAFFTGLGIYNRLGEFAGMGAALPVTGFANSVVSPALEYKREGYVLGVAAKMFQIAGPVIVYGTFTAASVVIVKFFLFKM